MSAVREMRTPSIASHAFAEAREVHIVDFKIWHKQLLDACQRCTVATPSVHQHHRNALSLNAIVEVDSVNFNLFFHFREISLQR